MGDLLTISHVKNGLNRSKTFTLNQINELSMAFASDIAVLTSAVEEISADKAGYSTFETGKNGLVPAPSAGDNEKFLRGDGTWATVAGGLNLGTASSTVNGSIWYEVDDE